MPAIRGAECERWIQQFAVEKGVGVAALPDSGIQEALKLAGFTASLFAIRVAKQNVLANRVAVARPPEARPQEAQPPRDVVRLDLAPVARVHPLGLSSSLSPGIRSALWGLSNLRDAAKMPRALFFERAALGIDDFAAYARARYGELGPSMEFDLAQLTKAYGAAVRGDFRQLLIDPNVVSRTHLKPFYAFALGHQKKLIGCTPFQVRQAYGNTLPAKTYYRALKLSAGLAEKFQREIGMTCRAFRSLPDYANLEQRIMRNDPTVLDTRELADAPLATVLKYHIRPFSRASAMRAWSTLKDKQPYLEKAAEALKVSVKDPKQKVNITRQASSDYDAARRQDLARLKDGDAFLSVSEDMRVALSVAADPDMAGKLKVGEAIYLFALKLFPLDVLDPADYLGTGESPSHVTFGGGMPEPYTAHIEGIVVGHIHHFEIMKFEKLDPAACTKFKMELAWKSEAPSSGGSSLALSKH
ncbi:hypothetical protein D7X74_21725 [Corallococcus sp. CA047B]|uniref:hypothetical protein n=1 Tax=Corallococcus sp. CA047B TaxID=2316729 RepID=UPI000EA0F44C|nr:hypothetical protein [Corallococcus sp. CA047B]RKH13486.1 hypothetical protein D7X74_21725 [Corallococcus sp. CA047B]